MIDKGLEEALRALSASDMYPFHMPGHKRRTDLAGGAAAIDITEIDGFDDLHCAEGLLLEAQQRAAAFYGAKRTFYLVNGSTSGILAAVCACARRGGEIIAARNSHRSLFHAARLRELSVYWAMPDPAEGEAAKAGINGPVSAEKIEGLLREHPGTCAVFVTSPTYDGIVSDIGAIADAAHRAGAVLIVDAAHGAHFGLHPDFPENACGQGADVVVHSLHKTLPSLTQTALLHLCSDRVSPDRIGEWLRILMTSSPSYVMMASMDSCIRLLEKEGEALFSAFASRLKAFRKEAKEWKTFRLPETDDPSRLLIGTGNSGLTGRELAEIFRRVYHLEPEMEAAGYVLMLTSIADTDEGFIRLAAAMRELEEKYVPQAEAAQTGALVPGSEELPETAMTIAEAMDAPARAVSFAESAGKICAEFLYQYPPGIPLLAPGEKITPGIIGLARRLAARGYALQGMADHSLGTIRIVAEAEKE